MQYCWFMSGASPILETDPDLAAAALANAERRRAMLERLAVLGMALAEEITQRMVDSPYHPEAVHEPGRAFAQVSRAVRLTLVLEAKMEAQIITLRNERILAGGATTVGPAPWSPLSEAARRDLTRPRRNVRDPDAQETLVEQTRERLSESEGDTRLAGCFRATVEAICSDLGLDPDWSCWPETEDAAVAPIIPVLTEFLASAAARAGPADDDRAVTTHRLPASVAPEPHPPPGT